MGFLQQLTLKVNFVLKSLFFLQYLPQAFFYSYQRDRYERKYLSPSETETITAPGKLMQAKAVSGGAYFTFEEAELEITFLTPDFVRIHWYPGLEPIPYAIAHSDWDTVETRLEPQGNDWVLTTQALTLVIGMKGNLTFYNPAGEVIRQEDPPQREGEKWQHTASLYSEEHIYGLGERATCFNLRAAKDEQNSPKTYQLWNFDPGNIYKPGTDPMYICIPVYLGLHERGSYLVFYENSFQGDMTFGENAITHFHGGALRYYVALGKPPQLLERYSQLTGRSPLPPVWAFGYHQSRWGYRTEATVRKEVETFKTHNVPLSAIYLDIDCQVEHRAFTIDPQRFPNFQSFTQELAELGVKLVAINNPGIKHSRQSNLFLEGQILNAFCTYPNGELVTAPVWAGKTVFPDFTNPQVREWWSQQFSYLLSVGVAGFWNDMSEPAAFVSWGDPTLPKVAQHNLEGRGGDHREAHNLYGMLEAKATYEGLRQHRPQTRPFVVSRSGWAGLQRYAWTWTGDIVSTWDALRQTVATVMGLGLSGIPYSGPDIGGFLGNPSPELYLRWFQMATFFTFCRTHSSTNVAPRAPWAYGEPYLSIMQGFLALRYSLMPYFYTLAWEAQEKGYPPVRPLFWLDEKDSALWNIDDAFCLGDDLVVYPIVEKGVRSRQVFLPQGHWYNFWDDTLIQGGQEVELEAPLEQIPLLVKAGTILPMENDKELTLHLYPPQKGESDRCIYSDAGEGYGDSRLDSFRMIRQDWGIEIFWESEGSYEFPYDSVQLHLHDGLVQQAFIDGQAMEMQGQTLSCGCFQRVYLNLA